MKSGQAAMADFLPPTGRSQAGQKRTISQQRWFTLLLGTRHHF
jgi:hypothetical protein